MWLKKSEAQKSPACTTEILFFLVTPKASLSTACQSRVVTELQTYTLVVALFNLTYPLKRGTTSGGKACDPGNSWVQVLNLQPSSSNSQSNLTSSVALYFSQIEGIKQHYITTSALLFSKVSFSRITTQSGKSCIHPHEMRELTSSLAFQFI